MGEQLHVWGEGEEEEGVVEVGRPLSHEVLIVLGVAAFKVPVVCKVVLHLGLHPSGRHHTFFLLLALLVLLRRQKKSMNQPNIRQKVLHTGCLEWLAGPGLG